MLASKKIARSTASSLKSTGSSVAKGKDSFIGYLYKRIMTIWKSMWGKTKSMMWVVSTGTYLIRKDLYFWYCRLALLI